MIEAGVGSATANSYVTLEEAEAHFAERLDVSVWAAADGGMKARALLMAARMLERLRWHGTRATAAQALCWPRVNAPGAKDGTIPAVIAQAQCEEALAWLRPELVHRRRLQAAGVTVAEIDSAREVYSAPPPGALLSPEARALLTGWVRQGGALVTDGGMGV